MGHFSPRSRGLRRFSSLIAPVLAGVLASGMAFADSGMLVVSPSAPGQLLSLSTAVAMPAAGQSPAQGSASPAGGAVVVQSVGAPSLPVGIGVSGPGFPGTAPGAVVNAPASVQAPGQPPLVATPPGKPVPGALLKPLALEVGSGQVVTLPAPAANVFEADPKIAEVRPASANTLFVFGVGPGRTTVAAMDPAGAILAQFSVSVTRSEFSAREAQEAIARVMPGAHIGVASDQRGLLLTGRVNSAGEAAQAVSIAKGFLGDGQLVENQIVTGGQVQVALRVRIAEMSREITRALGVNWAAAGSLGRWGVMGAGSAGAASVSASTASALSPFSMDPTATVSAGFANLDAVLEALSQDNLVHLLAEPNLTTMSGEPASFLVGGEFPIPVAQSSSSSSSSGTSSGTSSAPTITVEFKRYGVALSFVPTVLSDGRINLHVSPEVSELTTTGAISMAYGSGTTTIPALLVRRAETTVELGSGQSFAIAGLLQDSGTTNINAVPGIGDVPILGSLFRSSAFQRKETELVILVTPYIVRPVDNVAALKSPTDGFVPANDKDRFLGLQQFKNTVPPGNSALSTQGGPALRPASTGQAGFQVQ